MSTSMPTMGRAPAHRRPNDRELTDDERIQVARWLDPKRRREELTSLIWGLEAIRLMTWPFRICMSLVAAIVLTSWLTDMLGISPWLTGDNRDELLFMIAGCSSFYELNLVSIKQRTTILKMLEAGEIPTSLPLANTTAENQASGN